LILIARFQVTGLVIAYFIGLASKGVAAYFINNKVCYKQKYYFWQSMFAPLLAAAIHYLILDQINRLIWRDDEITSVLIFLIGILPSFPLYLFLYGLFGGWDDATLKEFKDATDMTGFIRPLVWVFYKASELGSRISPLNNRFPISNRAEAMAEAKQLDAEKIKL
jgi:hypothetical protein